MEDGIIQGRLVGLVVVKWMMNEESQNFIDEECYVRQEHRIY